MFVRRFTLFLSDSLQNFFIIPFLSRGCSGFDNSHNIDFGATSSDFEGQPSFEPRKSFVLPASFERQTWHPKHMGVQMKRMEGKLRTVDLVIEVHDCRVALSGRNPIFGERLFSVRPHILVLNKMDLIPSMYRKPIEDYYREQGFENIVWTNCKARTSKPLSNLFELMREKLQSENRFNRMVKTEYQVMVIGIPNVGKSSVLNSLRIYNLGFKKAVKEGPRPGVTIRVQNRVRIWDKPAIYLLDTPGILDPYIDDVDTAMKLAACNLILETVTKPYTVADFLLFHMNKLHDFAYAKKIDLPDGAPSNDIKKVLLHIAKQGNLIRKVYVGGQRTERWDIEQAAKQFLELFRANKLSDDCFLDRDRLGNRMKNY